MLSPSARVITVGSAAVPEMASSASVPADTMIAFPVMGVPRPMTTVFLSGCVMSVSIWSPESSYTCTNTQALKLCSMVHSADGVSCLCM